PVGPRVPQFLDDRLFGALVGHRYEVGGSLAADLQLLDLAEVAAKARCRLARGALHDGDQAGMGYQIIASIALTLSLSKCERSTLRQAQGERSCRASPPASHIRGCRRRRRSSSRW